MSRGNKKGITGKGALRCKIDKVSPGPSDCVSPLVRAQDHKRKQYEHHRAEMVYMQMELERLEQEIQRKKMRERLDRIRKEHNNAL